LKISNNKHQIANKHKFQTSNKTICHLLFWFLNFERSELWFLPKVCPQTFADLDSQKLRDTLYAYIAKDTIPQAVFVYGAQRARQNLNSTHSGQSRQTAKEGIKNQESRIKGKN